MSQPDLSTILANATSHASSDANLPDLSTILANATSHASGDANLPSLSDLMPETQGVPPSHGAATTQAPDSHSQADLHAGAGIIDHAAAHAHGTLPDLVSLTGHDWFHS